jgi:site-specific recombinase XerD
MLTGVVRCLLPHAYWEVVMHTVSTEVLIEHAGKDRVFNWAGTCGLEVLAATRAHIELYRHHMEQSGLAASTIDRRLSTVCGFYRFAHIDGRIASNPAQYVRRPKVHPSEGRGLDRNELGRFLFTAERFDRTHVALAVLLGLNGLRVSEECETNIEDLGLGQQTSDYSACAAHRPPARPRHR